LAVFGSFGNDNRQKQQVTNNKISPNHYGFAQAVAAGSDIYKAYLEHVATSKDIKQVTARVQGSKLAAKPRIKKLIEELKAAINKEVVQVKAREIAAVFQTDLLTVDEMDAYHSAIVQGKVMVEEVIPTREMMYKNGKIVSSQVVFRKVHRPPNVRERQISIDALYKRFGNYAPSRLFAAVAGVNDEGDLENVERVVILSDGTKLPLLSDQRKTG
jgi:hypothetical protein